MSDLVRLIDFHLKKNFEFYFKDISIWIKQEIMCSDCFCFVVFSSISMCRAISQAYIILKLAVFTVLLVSLTSCLAHSAVCSLTQLLPKKTSWLLSRNGVQNGFWDTSEMWCSSPGGITSSVQNDSNQLRCLGCRQNPMQLYGSTEPWPTKGLVAIIVVFPQILILSMPTVCNPDQLSWVCCVINANQWWLKQI